jgi:hypothetical protein
MADKQSDPRLIIEKGGYSPDCGGSTRPPVRPTDLDEGINKNHGYRPMSGRPTRPPTKPAPQLSSSSGTKK